MTTNIYLIRHGEAVANVTPIVAGMRGDDGLTKLGVAQAEALRDRLRASGEIKADALIASTLPRARQTAEIIQPAFGLPISFDDDAQEMRVGEADGLTVAEFKARFGLPDFQANPFAPIAPGGENWPQFTLRVGQTLQRVATEHAGKTVVIVCHGGFIDCSFIYFFGLSSMQLPQVALMTHNTSITHWRHADTNEIGALRWQLMRYNDDAHLHGVGRNDHVLWRDVEPAAPEPTGDHPAVPLPEE